MRILIVPSETRAKQCALYTAIYGICFLSGTSDLSLFSMSPPAPLLMSQRQATFNTIPYQLQVYRTAVRHLYSAGSDPPDRYPPGTTYTVTTTSSVMFPLLDMPVTISLALPLWHPAPNAVPELSPRPHDLVPV